MKRYIFTANSTNIKYTYSGYATDRFGNNLGKFDLITYAPSKSKAQSNFKFQIRNKLGKVKNFYLKLDESKIHAEINSITHNVKYVYHGTSTKQAAYDIINNGFNTQEADCSEVRYDAEGHGAYIIKTELNNILKNLVIYEINENRSFNPSDYGEDCDGIREPSHAESGKFIYYIFNVPKLNSVCNWLYDGER